LSIFISADLCAGLIQGFGLAIALSPSVYDSTADQSNSTMNVGSYITCSGLAIHGVALLASTLLLLAVVVRAAAATRRFGYPMSRTGVGYVPGSRGMRTFTTAVLLAQLCFLARSGYRVAFYVGGLQSRIAQDQTLLLLLEGVPITAALTALTAFHPAMWMQEEPPVAEGKGGKPRRRGANSDAEANVQIVSQPSMNFRRQSGGEP
jgi:hypothetical protein